MGPTSTQVGPYQNTNYMIRAFDQQAMGVPTSVTLYPNSLRRTMDSVLNKEDPVKGYKVDRYSQLLGPEDTTVNPLQNMPPNDQREGFGSGFAYGKVPSGPAQVAWSDDIRQRANDITNSRRVAQGLPRLTLEQQQELHWAAIGAESEGRPLVLRGKDTVQGSLPAFSVQHAWEAEPGASAGVQRQMPKEDYADQVYGVLSDPQGKDRLIRAMGGKLQQPIVRGTGVWEGDLSPGFQSRSFASHTQAAGMDPSSRARIDSTEAVRQFMLGQEGRAFSLNQATKGDNNQDIADILTGAPPSPQETLELQRQLGSHGVIAPTAGGYRAIKTDYTSPISVDQKGVARNGETFRDVVDRMSGSASYGRNIGGYKEMDWAGGNATENLLDTLESNGMPGPARLADSANTRQIAGEIADLYRRLDAEGGLSQNHKLTQALEAWRDGGLSALRSLVAKGLAPAVLLAVFAGANGQQEERQPKS